MTRALSWGVITALCIVGFASPAFAEKKAKGAAKAEVDESKSLDDMMKESGSGPEKKKGKKGQAEEPVAEPEEKAPEEEVVDEPDAWEKPPAEEEKAPPPPTAAAAPAEKVGDGNQLEIGVLVGWGFGTDSSLSSYDPYGFGFGVRAGYELDFKLYLGVGFEYFLGSSGTGSAAFGGTTGATVSYSANYMFGHLEAGYDIWVDQIIIRPSLWLGMAFASVDPYKTGGAATLSDFFFAPGVSVIYVMDGFFIGGDLRFHKVTGDGSSAVALYANAGLRF